MLQAVAADGGLPIDVVAYIDVLVMETIKEGQTIFALSAEEKQQAHRLNRPGGHNDLAFSQFVRKASHYAHATPGCDDLTTPARNMPSCTLLRVAAPLSRNWLDSLPEPVDTHRHHANIDGALTVLKERLQDFPATQRR